MTVAVGPLEIPVDVLPLLPVRGGSSAHILQSQSLESWLFKHFGARDLCLKVFPDLLTSEDEWEFVPLRETAEVQNLFAAEGWATRVYAIGRVNGGDMAEVVDYGRVLDAAPPNAERLLPFWALVDQHGIGTRSRIGPGEALKWDFLHPLAGRNWSCGRLLDWGGKYFRSLHPEWDEPQPLRRREKVMILNLGAGNRIVEGGVNHDIIRHRPEIDVAWDLNNRPWPWEDNTFDKIDARSVFEHLQLSLIEACDECWRLLQPRGHLVLMFPLATQATSFEDPTHRWHWTERSLDYLDPSTQHGRDYSYYTPRKWRILSCGVVRGRNVKAILEPAK